MSKTNLPLCVSPRCRRNQDTGELEPRPANGGCNLCDICTRILGEDTLIAAVRHRQLGLVLTGSGQPGEERTSRSKPDANLSINLRAAALRRDIETTIGQLARLIVDRRGFTWPVDEGIAKRPLGFIGPMPWVRNPTVRIAALCRFVARSRDWLAAHNDAALHAEVLRELARGQAYRVAFPGGIRRFTLPGMTGEQYLACPETDEDNEPCPGVLWTILRRDSETLPAEVVCNGEEAHQWPTSQWIRLGRKLLRRAGLSAT